MAKNNNIHDFVVSVADAIRARKGTTEPINPQDFNSEILGINDGLSEGVVEAVKTYIGGGLSDGVALGNAIAKDMTDEPTEQAWNGERTTAGGASIKDGVAFISSIKGRTLKMGQMANVAGGSWTPTGQGQQRAVFIPIVQGHKYLCSSDVYAPINYTGSRLWCLLYLGAIVGQAQTTQYGKWRRLAFVATATSSGSGSFQYIRNEASSNFVELQWKNVMAFDLTAMGMGDVATADEFAQRLGYASVDDVPYMPHTEGEIISMNAEKLKSIGRNLWNGEREDGSVDQVTGLDRNVGTATYRSIGYIHIKPNARMYATVLGGTSLSLWVMFYDENKNVIKGYATGKQQASNLSDCLNVSFITPSNGHYLRFYVKNDTEDVCINYYDPSFNGQYSPYMESVLPLDFSSIMYEGQPLFHNGLNGIGDVRDEVDFVKGGAVKRIVDTIFNGTEQWALQSINSYGIANFYCNVPNVNSNNLERCLTSFGIMQTTMISNTEDEGILLSSYSAETNTRVVYVRIKSSVANTVAAFKSYLASNPIRLITNAMVPIEVSFDPRQAHYKVENGGSEELVADGFTAPLTAGIGYGTA